MDRKMAGADGYMKSMMKMFGAGRTRMRFDIEVGTRKAGKPWVYGHLFIIGIRLPSIN